METSVIHVVEKEHMKSLQNVSMAIQALICIVQPMIMTIAVLPISTVHMVKPMYMINNQVIYYDIFSIKKFVFDILKLNYII